MSKLDRLEELKKLIQDDYITARNEYQSAVIEGNKAAQDYFWGVIQTLECIQLCQNT